MVSKFFVLALGLACFVSSNFSCAALVHWTAELNRNGNFVVDNQSTGAYSIKSITFDLSSTTGGVTVDSSSATMHALGTIGSFNTVISDPTLIDFTAPGGLSNDLPFIKTTIGTAGNLFTFNFEPGTFASGEGWGLDAVVFNKTGGGVVTRANMSGGKISVLFWEFPTPLEAVYSASNANGGSFPIQASAVPEPSGFLLTGAMFGLACGSTQLRRRRIR